MSCLVDTFVVRKAHFRGAAIIRHSISPEQSRWTRRKFPRSCGSLRTRLRDPLLVEQRLVYMPIRRHPSFGDWTWSPFTRAGHFFRQAASPKARDFLAWRLANKTSTSTYCSALLPQAKESAFHIPLCTKGSAMETQGMRYYN